MNLLRIAIKVDGVSDSCCNIAITPTTATPKFELVGLGMTEKSKIVLSPRPIFLSLFQLFRQLLRPQFFRYISVHSVQLRLVETQSHIAPPISCETERSL